jgi:hypothetical protein
MNKQLIRDLAISGGIYDCICDPYDKLENGDYYSSVMVDLERFAEKIVRECLNQCYNRGMNDSPYVGQLKAAEYIEEHFGVKSERKS